MNRSKNIGISLLMVIFLVLCLTVFAVLSFSTSQSDYNLTQDKLKNSIEYYTACNAAEMQLSSIDKVLYEIREELINLKNEDSEISGISADYLSSRLNSSENYAAEMTVTDNSGIFDIGFSIRINDCQTLKVGLTVTDAIKTTESAAEHFYNLNTWQITND